MSDVTVQPIPPPEAGDGAPGEGAPPPGPPALGRSGRRRAALIAALVALLLAGGAAAAYFVALRPDRVRVPALVGRDQATAARLATSAGLHARFVRVTSPQPAGLVVAQSPRARTRADRDSTLVLRLSSGPGRVTVPDVRGQAPPAAEQALRDAGLAFTLARQASTSVPAGQVAGTTPAAGSQAPRGSTVRLAVSTGPASVRTPKVVGQRQPAAQSKVTAAGFQVVIVRQESAQPAGQVISQRPAPGQRRKKGTTIELTVATAPPQVSVPDVTGLDLESAVTTLSGLGLRIAFHDQRGPRPDTIASQDPPAHSSVAKGATVTLTVNKR